MTEFCNHVFADFTSADLSTQPATSSATTESASAEEQADEAGGLDLALIGPGVAVLAVLLLLALAIGRRKQSKAQRLRALQQQSIYSTAQGSSIFSIGSGQDIYSSMSLNTMGGYRQNRVPYGGNSEMNFEYPGFGGRHY